MLCRCCKVIMHWFGYNGIRSLWHWIVRHRNPLLFLLFPLVPLFRFLTYSKKDRNESETSDDNTRALKNSPDDAERVISPELKRSSDNGEEPETKWTRSNQDNFQNDRVETADKNVSKEINIYSKVIMQVSHQTF